MGDLGAGLVLVDGDGGDFGTQGRQQGRIEGCGAVAGEGFEHSAGGLGVAAGRLEHQTFEVGRGLDVHGDAAALDRRTARIEAVVQGAGQGVVLVHRRDEAVGRQAHPCRGDAGEGVAEIAGRDDEGCGLTQLGGGGDVIGDLARQPRPVDGVDRRQAAARAQGVVGQQPLHQPLAVVEIAAHGQVQHIVGLDRRHLFALDRRDAIQRVQHDQIDGFRPGEGAHGGGAGVARRGGQDGQPLARGGQGLVRQTGDQLHRQVLEGGGRAVEQLQHEQPRLQLDQGRDQRMVEAGDHAIQRPVQRAGRQGVADEERQNLKGDGLVVRCAGPGVGRQGRPGVRHIEAAVGRDAAQQGVGEIGFGRSASGRDVAGAGSRHGGLVVTSERRGVTRFLAATGMILSGSGVL